MTKLRRNFTDEFKREAVVRFLDRGRIAPSGSVTDLHSGMKWDARRPAVCQACQSACSLCQARLTVSLPTAPPNSAASAQAHPPCVGARQIGAGNQSLGLAGQPLVRWQRLVAPFRRLAVGALQARPKAAIENLLDEDYEELYGYRSPGIGAFAGLRGQISF